MLQLFAQAVEKSSEAAAKTVEAAKTAVDAVKTAAEPVAEKTADAAASVAENASASWDWLGDFIDAGALGMLIKGGTFMWLILLLGVIVLGVIIERFRSLKMLNTDTSKLRGDVLQLLQMDRVDEALKRCDIEQGPVPAVLSTGVRKYYVLRKLKYDPGRIEEQVVKSMDDYSVHIVAALEKHLPVLATIASVAPMVGFLGTVQGMIVAFTSIEAMENTNIVKAAAGGISVALLTTCLGLIVGIPAYMAFNYFTSVINRFVLDVEEAGTELIESVTFQMAVDESVAQSGSVQAGTLTLPGPPLG